MQPNINPSGFTDDEERCHQALMECTQIFCELPRQHPQELQEFIWSVHQIQGILATRVLRRTFPEDWPVRDATC